MLLVLLRGLPGSGKSTLAKALAPRLEAVVLDKDVVRAALFPLSTVEYTGEQDDLVIDAMLLVCGWHLAKRTVILDGRTHGRRAQVDRVRRFCEARGARLVIVECVVPVELAMARVEGDRGHLAGNRNAELVARIAAGWEELPEGDAVIRVDMTGALEAAVAMVVGRLGLGRRLES
jgi:predicted kinase